MTKPPDTPVGDPPKKKKHNFKRLKRVEPKWIRRAALTLLHRKINQLLDLGPNGNITKDDVDILIKALEAARKLEKDSDPAADILVEAI